jgi:Domain of unknown function (DUF4282)
MVGFFRALFDFSFTEFVTTRLIRLLYAIGVLFAAVAALVAIIRGFDAGAGAGIVALILSPLIFLLVVIIARVWLEIIIVVFRIAEYLRDMAGERPSWDAEPRRTEQQDS